MIRNVLVWVHAGSGVAGLLAGLPAFSPPRRADGRAWLRGVYMACLLTLFASLVALILIDWDGLDTSARIAFAALAGLAAVMIVRIVLAVRVASSAGEGWKKRYIGHVYFTYISLWEGFVILPALNLPLPQVSVPSIAVAVLVVGHVLRTRYERRILES